ncbi:hypothetical protein [Nocardia thraciensis]
MTEPRGDDLTERIVTGLRELAPPGWQRLDAWFAVTVVAETGLLMIDDGTQSVQCPVPDTVWTAVRQHRSASVRSNDGPWWRLLVRVDADGSDIVADHGVEPFPVEQLFAPDAYLADLERYPRERLPVWLAAYVGRGVPQSRPPGHAADRARADERAGVRAVAVTEELPDLTALWARWAALSAAFVAVRSERGPRIVPSVGMFEGAARSGSILTLLPGDRAVLSGGVWEAPVLDAAYNTGAAMPDFFAGAPEWVAGPVLDPRATVGLLSFCYWWEDGQWYRGESAPMSECAEAMPAVWTADTVAGVVGGLIGDRTSGARAAEQLVSAAQTGTVNRATIADTFGQDADIDGALFQFMVAGLTAAQTDRIAEADAVELVRDHIRQRGYDTTGYQLSGLQAHRVNVGWLVRSPVPAGEVAVHRAVFYVADDGVVERSTSSVPLSAFVAGFERRLRFRRDSRTGRDGMVS